MKKVLICIICISCFTTKMYSQELTHPSVNKIIDLEKIGNSIVYISDYVDGNMDYKGIYRFDLSKRKVFLVFSQKFDGRYLGIIKNTETTFTVEVEYEYETELFNYLFSEDDEKFRMSLETLKALKKKVDLNDKYNEKLKKDFKGNIWKSSRIKDNLIVLSTNKWGDDKYYLLRQNLKNKSIDTLLMSNKIIPFCVDEKNLYSIIDMKLRRFTLDSICKQGSID